MAVFICSLTHSWNVGQLCGSVGDSKRGKPIPDFTQCIWGKGWFENNSPEQETLYFPSSSLIFMNCTISGGLPATSSRRKTRWLRRWPRPEWPSSRGGASPRTTFGGASTSEQNMCGVRSVVIFYKAFLKCSTGRWADTAATVQPNW